MRAQSCPLCNCSPAGSPVRGILQARTLAGLPHSPQGIVPSQDSGIKPMSPGAPALAGGFFITEPPGKPLSGGWCLANPSLCCGVSGTLDGVKGQPTYQPTECLGATVYRGMGSLPSPSDQT